MSGDSNTAKPKTCQADLAKLPRALAPLLERRQWAVWRWTQQDNGRWQKPPFIATQPERHASTKDPGTWANYDAALAAVQAGYADGITYVLTQTDPFAAIDLDHCRDVNTSSIDVWAQNFLDAGRHSYSEVTPSGAGCRIWGLSNGDSLHKKFTLEIDGKPIAAELFRRANKALTITGYKLDNIQEFDNIDRVLDWALAWAERRKAAAAEAAAPIGDGFNGKSNGSGYSIGQIEEIVHGGAPAGANRSNLFHAVVGHYVGCGWSAERIFAHLQQFPDGIGGRYLSEGRLSGEIARSAGKYDRAAPLFSNSWANGFEAKAPPPQPEAPENDPELEDDDNDPELEDESPQQDYSKLPALFAHGDEDPRPLKSWLIKQLIPACGHGLLSGQWGAGKTFVVFDLAAALGTCREAPERRAADRRRRC